MTSTRILTIRILRTFPLILAIATLLATLAATTSAQNPVPFIDQPLVPDATAPGGPAFTLTVNGAGFVPASVVNWSGSPRATTFVSSSRLTAKILASDVAKASTAAVTVVNPIPGGGASNIQHFSIAKAATSVSFLRPVAYDSGETLAWYLATEDVNGDGIPDVAVVNYASRSPGGYSSVGVLLGNGNGTLRPAVAYGSGGYYASGIAIADLNGDGKPDLVVAHQGCPGIGGCLGVLLGNGDGTFQPAVIYPDGFYDLFSGEGILIPVMIADVNGDGIPDLVAINQTSKDYGDGSVGILLGNGDGTFKPVVTYDSGGLGTLFGVLADVNGDGKLDLVVLSCGPSASTDCPSSDGTVGVLLGNGDGTFQPVKTYSSGGWGGSFSLILADLNGDGKLDIVVGNNCPGNCSEDGSFAVLLGNGDGTFQAAVSYDSGAGGVGAMAVADLNGDGYPDLVVASDQVSVWLGKGDGAFLSANVYPTSGGTGQVFLVDLGGNNKLDLVGVNGTSDSADVRLGNGDGTFQELQTYALGGSEFSWGTVSDVVGNGRPALLSANWAGGEDGAVGVLLQAETVASAPTSTALASALNPSVYGQSVTFTATVSSTKGTPTGTVKLYNGSIAAGSGTLTSGKATILVSSLPAGSDSITAAYQGSATFSASTSAPLSQIVKIASTTTSLTSSLNPAATGQFITFTATVTGQYGGAATGSVTFLSGSQTLGTATLSGNRAILTTSFATAGTYSISAKYNGDGNNTGSTSSTLGQVVAAATTTALVSSLNPSLIGQAVAFTATVSSTAGTPPNGETITFKNGSALLGTASLSGGVAFLTTSSLPAGIYAITATYSGDATFAPSTSPGLRQVVNSTTKSATSTTLISSLNPSIYGQKVTWTAMVTTSGPVPPTGKVNFTWGDSIGTATLNASGIATLTRSALNANTYPLTAVYEGDANNLRSASVVLSQVVSEATSAATLTSSPNPSTAGQSVTFTATIKSPTVAATGPVTFTAGKTVLGTAQLADGKATFTISTLAVGTNTVTATYYGDSNISGSSAFVKQTVGSAASLIEDDGKLPIQSKTTRSTNAGGCYSSTTLTTSGSPNLVGNQVVFTASVNAAGYCNNQPQGSCYEPITFYDGNTVIGSVPLNRACVASFTDNSLTAKTHKIKAYFPGTGEGDPPSYSNAVTQVITGYPTATTLSSILTPSAYGQSVTWTATVTSPSPFGYLTMPTGKVDFTWGGVYTIGTATLNASGVATLTKSNLNADSYPLTATYVGDPNNAGSTSATLAQVVTPTTSAATLTSSPNPATEGQAVTFLASITSPTITASGPVTFSTGNTVLGTAELVGGKARFTTSTLAVGANPVTVTYSGDSNISGSSVSVTEIVQP